MQSVIFTKVIRNKITNIQTIETTYMTATESNLFRYCNQGQIRIGLWIHVIFLEVRPSNH
jgi:hypothetical protein